MMLVANSVPLLCVPLEKKQQNISIVSVKR